MVNSSQIARPSWSAFPSRRRPQFRPRWSGYVKAGFTLLEIILALAILAGSIAALGEIMRLAEQNAGHARDEATAELLASSLMDEILSGVRPLQIATKQPFEYPMESPWVYSVVTETTNFTELMRVGVRVELNIDGRLDPPHYEVYRWVMNPQFVQTMTDNETRIAQEAEAQKLASEQRLAQAATTTTTTGGGTTAGGGTGTTGGGN